MGHPNEVMNGRISAPLPSPTLLIKVGSHTTTRTQPSPSGSTNGPSDGLKVLLVKELWLVIRREEERREKRQIFLVYTLEVVRVIGERWHPTFDLH